MIDTKIIPNQHVTPQAVTSLDRITGMVTVAPILKGEQITLTKLSSNPRPEGGGLAGITPVGKRAITISVDNVAAVAGLIKPGDYVDVISLIGVPMRTADDKIETQIVVLPLFQNVLVLAVGRDTGSPKKEGGRYQKEGEDAGGSLITLALSPQEASLIAFISEQGRIRLILRSPADAKLETTQTASWDTLFRYINPNYSDQPPSQPMPVVSENREEAKPAVPQGETIEIYRGLSKERIPISR
jgi:pilus assembly protein CpaB